MSAKTCHNSTVGNLWITKFSYITEGKGLATGISYGGLLSEVPFSKLNESHTCLEAKPLSDSHSLERATVKLCCLGLGHSEMLSVLK